ncbi:MAG: SRPBCC family protein [Chromatiales bacterium]
MHKLLKYFSVAVFALPLLVYAHGPSRLKVEKEITVNAPAEKVWDLIKDFCAIDNWHPAVSKCEGNGGNEKGARRVLTLNDANSGLTIDDEMTGYDAAKMMYRYRITRVDPAVLPVSTYASQIEVIPDGGNSKVHWKGAFYRSFTQNNPPPEQSDEAATSAITGLYEAGLAEIKKLAEGGE